MRNNTIVVFDLDDTLFYEIEYVESAYKYISDFLAANYLINNVFDFMINAYHNQLNVFKEVNSQFSIEVPIQTYIDLYRTHSPKISITEETKKVLIELRKNEVIIGLLTDGRELTQMNKISSLKLGKYIKKEDIVISESFGSMKPSVENYLYFQNKYSPANFIYIGDNAEKDFLAPNKLGWTTICLLDKGKNIHHQNFDYTFEYLPQIRISSISDLLNFI
jgi:putative hydrolase of the HAD superfamily